MKIRLAIVIGCAALLAMFGSPVNSIGSFSSKTIEIGIEADWHHIGDGLGFSSFVIPDAEGPYWETEFYLTRWQVRGIKSAHLAFFLMDSGSQYDTVTVNGMTMALPGTEQLDKHHADLISKTVISIPVGSLHSGTNYIRFDATELFNPSPDNTHDDFEFGDVVLIVSK